MVFCGGRHFQGFWMQAICPSTLLSVHLPQPLRSSTCLSWICSTWPRHPNEYDISDHLLFFLLRQKAKNCLLFSLHDVFRSILKLTLPLLGRGWAVHLSYLDSKGKLGIAICKLWKLNLGSSFRVQITRAWWHQLDLVMSPRGGWWSLFRDRFMDLNSSRLHPNSWILSSFSKNQSVVSYYLGL